MRRRREPKHIYGWGWLGDAAEEAAVRATAPPRRLKNAGITTTSMKAKTAADRAGVPAKPVSGTQLTDDEYRQLAKQQYESEGEIEIDPHARVSRSEDQTGEMGAWVQAWVFVSKPGRG